MPKCWPDVSVATAAFGHGVAVTPLQFIDAAGGIVRDGTHVPITLLKRDPADLPARSTVSPATSALLRWLMWLVVKDGTGTRANLDSYEIGGKTGTAEKPGRGGYSADRVLASFLRHLPDRCAALYGFPLPGRAQGRRGELRSARGWLDRGARGRDHHRSDRSRPWGVAWRAASGGGLSRAVGRLHPDKVTTTIRREASFAPGIAVR